MSQSRKRSLQESAVNIAVGYSINYAANLVILPLFGFHVTAGDNALIGLLYTGVSLVRSYCIRRWFTRRD